MPLDTTTLLFLWGFCSKGVTKPRTLATENTVIYNFFETNRKAHLITGQFFAQVRHTTYFIRPPPPNDIASYGPRSTCFTAKCSEPMRLWIFCPLDLSGFALNSTLR